MCVSCLLTQSIVWHLQRTQAKYQASAPLIECFVVRQFDVLYVTSMSASGACSTVFRRTDTTCQWKLQIKLSILLQCEYEIQVQLLEIYNEQLRDLLDNTKSHARLDIRNTERSGLNVPDAIQVHLLHVSCDWHGTAVA